MTITVRLFAAARDLTGADRVTFDLPEGATVGQLRAALIERHPALAALVRHCVFAVGTEYAADATVVADKQEVACIPPVSGG